MAPLSDTAPAIAPPSRGASHPNAVFWLAAHPISVGVARRKVREQLRCWGLASGTCDDVLLVVSELVTNAIVHTVTDTVVCRLRGGPEIFVEVGSEGHSAFRGDARSPGEGEGGRGLLVVEALSTRWGIDAAGPGDSWTAWATIAVPAAAGIDVREDTGISDDSDGLREPDGRHGSGSPDGSTSCLRGGGPR